MTHDLQLVLIAGLAIVAVISITVIGDVTRRRRRSASSRGPSLLPLEDRMARLEQAVDVIAVEMERVSEGQRFLTRVLSERPDKG